MPGPKIQPLVEIGPFGSVVSQNGQLYTPKGKANTSLNLRSNKSVGHYIPIQGRTLYSSSFANNFIWFAVGKIYSRTVNTSTTPYTYTLNTYYVAFGIDTSLQRLVFVTISTSGGTVEIQIASTPGTSGGAPNPSYAPGPADEAVAVSMGNETYFCYGKIYGPYYDTNVVSNLWYVYQPVKINEQLTAGYAQIVPPVPAGDSFDYCSITVGTSGGTLLNGYYSYYFTASITNDGDVQESSPVPLTYGITATFPSGQKRPASAIVVTQAVNQSITLGFAAALYGILTSAPYNYSTTANAVTINIYRNSSASQSGQPQLIGNFALSALSGGAVNYVDGYPDASVSGQALIMHQDPPPNFFTMCTHKSRMWGFGFGAFGAAVEAGSTFHSNLAHGSELWYSAVNQAWSWDNTNQIIDCGRNDQGDNAVALAEVGSVLLAFKNKTTWIIYGSTPADFLQEPLFEIGCISQRLTVQAYGAVYWIAPNGQIWCYNGQLQYISNDVQNELYALLSSNAGNFNSGNGWAFERSVFFNVGGVVFEYQIDRNEWWRNGVVCAIGYYNTETAECVGFIGAASTTFASYYQNEGDLGSNMGSSWTSGVLDCGDPLVTKEFTHVMIESLTYVESVSVQVTVDPGPNQIQQTISAQLNSNKTRQLISLPKGLIGFEVQVQISMVTISYTELQRVVVYGIPKRRAVIPG